MIHSLYIWTMVSDTVLLCCWCLLKNLSSLARSSLCLLFMAKICCSIEMEPRTLSQVQLNHARERAADVVQKLEPNEASATFSEGLRPISSKREMEEENTKDEGEGPENTPIVELGEVQVVYCHCLCAAANIVETPDQEKLKEPLSAPF